MAEVSWPGLSIAYERYPSAGDAVVGQVGGGKINYIISPSAALPYLKHRTWETWPGSACWFRVKFTCRETIEMTNEAGTQHGPDYPVQKSNGKWTFYFYPNGVRKEIGEFLNEDTAITQ